MNLTLKNLLALQLLVLIYTLSYAQDTVYLDRNFKTTQKSIAEYFKVLKPVVEGVQVQYYTMDGRLTSLQTYQDKTLKILNGPTLYYYDNSKKDSEGEYLNDKRDGVWKFYFYTGQVSCIAEFKNGNIAKENDFDHDGNLLKGPAQSQHEPIPNGGMQALNAYISQNFNIPKELKNMHGKIIVAFVVDRDGRVTNVHIDKSLNEKLDQEALRVVSSLPDWTPGIQFNRPVRVRYNIPIEL